MNRSDVTVVIRASGERTEELCKYIVEKQVPKDQVFLINEKPFWKAVQRTFEIGIEDGRKWTLAVDADVLLKEGAVSEMVEQASLEGEGLYIYQGYVEDYVFGEPREGGPHLYSTAWLQSALGVLESNGESLRPESDTYHVLSQRNGAIMKVDDRVFGFHDFFQYKFDLMRKAHIHAIKHNEDAWDLLFIKHWARLSNVDDAKALFQGWTNGKTSLASQYYLEDLKCVFERLEFSELVDISNIEFEFLYQSLKVNPTTHSLKKKIIPQPQEPKRNMILFFLGKVFFKLHLVMLSISIYFKKI